MSTTPQTMTRGAMKAIAAELARSELFHEAPECILYLVVEQSHPRDLARGEILLSPRRPNHHMYVVLSGSLSVNFEAPDSPVIRELGRGASVGEMSLIDDSLPSAYVVAHTDCRVLAIPRAVLFELLAEANVVTRNMLRLLTRWIKANTVRIVEDGRKIAELSAQAQYSPESDQPERA